MIGAGHGVDTAPSVGLHGWSSRNWRVSSRNSSALPSGIPTVGAEVAPQPPWHVLEERAVPVAAALLERHAPVLGGAARNVAGVVVLDLVVVPDRDQRELPADLEQVRVRVVERVLGAVLGERLRLAVGRGRVGTDRPAVRLLVDVVAEAHDEVDVLLRQVRVRVVVAGHELLAGEERDPQPLARAGRIRGTKTARGRCAVTGDEAIRVLLARRQPGHAAARRPVAVAGDDQPLAVHDPPVARNLQLDQRGTLQPLEPRPKGASPPYAPTLRGRRLPPRYGPRGRLTGRHALLERDITRESQLARSGEDIGGRPGEDERAGTGALDEGATADHAATSTRRATGSDPFRFAARHADDARGEYLKGSDPLTG